MMRKLSLKELNRATVKEFKAQQKAPIVLILDNVRSGRNVGSAFRSSDAFNLTELALCGITARPPHKEILKTAIGASESVDWRHFEESLAAILYYKELGYTIFSVEQTTDSTSLEDLKIEKDKKYAIVMGNEVNGVDQKVIDASDGCIEIPQFGIKHSLNVSVCTGVVLWEITKQLLTQEA